jgi:hypothetical protein
VPVGEVPPLTRAVSRIVPPSFAAEEPLLESAFAEDPVVESVNAPGRWGTALGCATGLAGVSRGGGSTAGGSSTTGGGSTAGGGSTGQFAIVSLSVPELEVPSRVCAEDHDDDAVTAPSPLGIATVSEDELPANDARPCILVMEPPAGWKTIAHSGVLRPLLPLPEELKYAQSNVTDLQVAVAVTVCACALAAKTASNTKARGMMLRERRTIARGARPSIGVPGNLSVVMLALLMAGFWTYRRRPLEVSANWCATRSFVASGHQLRWAPDGFPARDLALEAVRATSAPAVWITAGGAHPPISWARFGSCIAARRARLNRAWIIAALVKAARLQSPLGALIS